MEKLPLHFYRYRSLAEENAKYVRRTLKFNELYFSSPLSFNDPFDCSPSFDFTATDSEKNNYYVKIIAKNLPSLSSEEVLALAKQYLINPISTKDFQETYKNKISGNVGILSFSEVPDSILMWSHYANNHEGICLEFDSQFDFFVNAHQVNYNLKRAKINPFRNTTEQMMVAGLLAKAKQWKYEKEWRIIQYRNGYGIYTFPPESLTGIILGARISEENKNKIKRWVKGRKTPLKIIQAVPSINNYSLKIKRL